MDPTQIGLFDLAERRLAWADRTAGGAGAEHRQCQHAGLQAARPAAVRRALADASVVAPVRTQPNHLAGTRRRMAPDEVVDRTHRASPDGNAVALDEQLVKVADTETTHHTGDDDLQDISRHVPHALGRGSSG